MAIPQKPLVITGEDGKPFDLGELYLEESALFEPGRYDRHGVVKFLQEHSNWTRREIALIKEKDLADVWEQVVKKVNEATTPLEK